ncbi:MAG: hypothetical protein WBC31_08085 [Candidatus Phosphoribacter baldrii]
MSRLPIEEAVRGIRLPGGIPGCHAEGYAARAPSPRPRPAG